MTRPVPLRIPAAPAIAFLRGERGSLTILGLSMFLMMLVAGGIALDVMRSEVQRTELQTAIDRGILASASLDQTRDAETVMRDYLRASGIDGDSVTITAFDNGSRRSVEVEAMARTPSLFLDMLGVDELRQPIRASALEVRTELELSLVVDISGSMGDGKIDRLRSAAKDFVAKLLRGVSERTYVSLVPYNEWVNLGSVMEPHFPMTGEHSYSSCVVFADADYLRTDLPAGALLGRKGHFDRSSSGMSYGRIRRPECTVGDYGAVLPWSNNVTELQDRIDTLRAGGSTAINVGAKIGTLLLDPSSRASLAAMAADTTLPEASRVDDVFVGRPVDYGTAGTFKVLVVMTDGVNNSQRDVRPQFKSGPSTVHVYQDRRYDTCDDDGTATDCADYDPSGPVSARHPFGTPLNPNSSNNQPDDTWRPRYSFWSEAEQKYFVHWNRTWQDEPWGGDQAVQIAWPDLLAHAPVKWMADGLLAEAGWATRNQYRAIWHTTHNANREADENLHDICAAARAQGIVIYTIAFQAPLGGRDAMRDCAGPDNEANYFDIQGLDIDSAFDDVLAGVNRLRLTR